MLQIVLGVLRNVPKAKGGGYRIFILGPPSPPSSLRFDVV
jgi:hypothetical protein